MKTATLHAPFFLFAFLTIIPSIASDIVRDNQGYPVKSNEGPYYFLSGNDHGLQIARTGNDACALSVVQVPNRTQGLPLRISSKNIHHLIVTDELVNIEFDGVTPSHWQAQDGYVKVGFNNESPKGTFMLKEGLGYGYEILYCPPDSDDACKYLKLITDDDNNKRLALGDSSDSYSNYHVAFKKKVQEQECTCTCPERSVV